jgi:hypothetical protein
MAQESHYAEIVEKLKDHSSMKQFIHRNTMTQIAAIKKSLINLSLNLSKDVTAIDNNVEIVYTDGGEFEAEIKFSGDALIFAMHTNVFTFPAEHKIHQLPFVKANPKKAYCGLIQIYNFLSDSIKYNRLNDLGYLVTRIFINSENQFFLEGKDDLNYGIANYENQIFDQKAIEDIIQHAIIFSIDFELQVPPLEQSEIITLAEKQYNTTTSGMSTGKRLGFEFKAGETKPLI